jgi:predicted GH43/DUF377 family glycosyl hydrolase
MYYTSDGDTTAIRRATSDDGKLWVKGVQNTVLVPGDTGAWDAEAVTDPSVIVRADGYLMYYAGESRDGREEIGLATSSDGRQWRKHAANPVIRVGAEGTHDSAAVSNPMVVATEGGYSLWYTAVDDAGTETTALATSEDGVTWTRPAAAPALGMGPAGSFYETEVSDPGVVQAGDESYWLFFSAVDAAKSFDPLGRRSIGRADSSDGMSWQVVDTPVLTPNPDASAFDSLRVTSAEVELVDGEYYMYYVGTSDDEDLPEGSVLPDQSVTQQINVGGIGLAISRDGMTWTRFSAPVLTADSLHDGAMAGDPSVLVLPK